MLLALDVGNTNTVVGVFDGADLKAHWRLSTRRAGTSDEYGIFVKSLFDFAGLDFRAINAVILSTVVPTVQGPLEEMSRQFFSVEAMVVGPGLKSGMPILYEAPREVGADRIVNAVAAFEMYGGPCIVVDFGTATTFDVVTERGEYSGGVIVPGISISADALFEKAARLWRVEIRRPERVIGKTTIASVQSGLYFGYLSLVDGVVDRIARELGVKPRVIATGGLAELFGGGSERIEEVDPLLTLKGLLLIHERNRAG